MENIKVVVKNEALKDLVIMNIELPEWAEFITLEQGILTAWNNEPQWKNGTFYADPYFFTEEVGELSSKVYLVEPWKACRKISTSRGVAVFYAE